MQRTALRQFYGAFLAPVVADRLVLDDPGDLRHGVAVLRDRLGLSDEALAEVLVLDLGVPAAGLAALGVAVPSWAAATSPLLAFSANVHASSREWAVSAGIGAAVAAAVLGLG